MNELSIIPAHGVETYRASTDAAGLCRDIVLKTAQNIQGKKYVRVEGWQAIAVAHGCAASAGSVERIEGGTRAIGQVRRMSDGVVIAEAEGFVGEDEATWYGGKATNGKMLPKRSDFAIRAMAQTRAISRVCRSAFAHVVVMIDNNLSTTPAEEMQGVYPVDDIKQEAEEISRQQNVERRKAAQPPLRKPKPSRAEWTDYMIDDIKHATATGELDMIMGLEENVTKIDQLAEQNHSLWQKITDAEREQRMKLEATGS